MLSRRRLARAAAAAGLCLSTAAAAWAQDRRLQQYLGLARATQAQPVTSAEIEAALLSADGVEDLARLFEQALAEKVTVAGAPVTPELGGEATLEHGVIRFVSYPDPLHALVRRMLELRDEPRALLRLASASAEGRQVLEKTGGLHALLYQMTTREPRDADRRALERVMDAAVALHFKTWNVTPETQRAAILRHDWTGRYVGFWHIHPPQPGAGGYGPGLEPSHEDMAIAVEKGQMLTVVFQPDGFDAWDLAPLAAAGRPDLSKARVVRHRSPVWEERFRDGRR
jgi:hypothetical protein